MEIEMNMEIEMHASFILKSKSTLTVYSSKVITFKVTWD